MAWSTESRHARGYGTRWTKLREARLRIDSYLCVPCSKERRTTPATEVDHVQPKAKGGTDDMDNLQSICSECHKAKTARDEGRQRRRETGADGYPTGG